VALSRILEAAVLYEDGLAPPILTRHRWENAVYKHPPTLDVGVPRGFEPNREVALLLRVPEPLPAASTEPAGKAP
jgi:hypothetical protein